MLVVGGGHAPSEGLAMDYLRLWTMGLDEDKYLIIFIKNQSIAVQYQNIFQGEFHSNVGSPGVC